MPVVAFASAAAATVWRLLHFLCVVVVVSPQRQRALTVVQSRGLESRLKRERERARKKQRRAHRHIATFAAAFAFSPRKRSLRSSYAAFSSSSPIYWYLLCTSDDDDYLSRQPVRPMFLLPLFTLAPGSGCSAVSFVPTTTVHCAVELRKHLLDSVRCSSKQPPPPSAAAATSSSASSRPLLLTFLSEFRVPININKCHRVN